MLYFSPLSGFVWHIQVPTSPMNRLPHHMIQSMIRTLLHQAWICGGLSKAGKGVLPKNNLERSWPWPWGVFSMEVKKGEGQSLLGAFWRMFVYASCEIEIKSFCIVRGDSYFVRGSRFPKQFTLRKLRIFLCTNPESTSDLALAARDKALTLEVGYLWMLQDHIFLKRINYGGTGFKAAAFHLYHLLWRLATLTLQEWILTISMLKMSPIFSRKKRWRRFFPVSDSFSGPPSQSN